MRPGSGPVVCVSYLAAAELWTVPKFPRANQGVEVLAAERSIAADAPMTAAALAALGVPVLLVSNDVGDDGSGDQVRAWLRQNQVAATCTTRPGATIPRIVVVADEDATRTWFAHLPGVTHSLAQAGLTSIETASFVYVDGYRLIEAAARQALEAARSAGVPLLLNLGGSDPSPSMLAAMRDCRGLTVQTNVNESEHKTAPTLAAALLARTRAEWVVITAGAFGAVAVSESATVTAPAFRAEVRHTHCAGAAFSGGLLYGLRAGWTMAEATLLGSASGALRCERPHNAPMPTPAELRAVITSRERIGLLKQPPSAQVHDRVG
jgi:sugar/nucleoside kinase (ribokinase family)